MVAIYRVPGMCQVFQHISKILKITPSGKYYHCPHLAAEVGALGAWGLYVSPPI